MAIHKITKESNPDIWAMLQPPEQSVACEDCKYYTTHRCKLWEVKVEEPDNSHCESFQRSN